MVLETSAAGLASFLSPCILPILPGFISYLSGTAINEAKNSVQDTSTTTITSSEKVGIIESTSDSGGRGQQKQQQQRSSTTTILARTRLNIFHLFTLYLYWSGRILHKECSIICQWKYD